MRLRFRFTVRGILVLVAAVAILIPVGQRVHRWSQRMRTRPLAWSMHARLEADSAAFAKDMARMAFSPDRKARMERKAAWHARRARLYTEASRRPWWTLPSVPDEPEP